jgi:hypothetical protein
VPFARRTAAVGPSLLLLAGGLLVLPAANVRAEEASTVCKDADLAVLPMPLTPWKGAPLRVIFAAAKPLDGKLSLTAPDGSVATETRDRLGGPPYYWLAEIDAPAAGKWHATLTREGASPECRTITREIVVSARKPAAFRGTQASVWPVRNTWNRQSETLFSVWVEKLFDAPPEKEQSWKNWHEVLQDRSRNVLFDYLGLGEDRVVRSVRPDCADFVYFLRAYFAFKMGLPFGYSNCSRGSGGNEPKCYDWFDISHPAVTRPAPPPERIAAPEPENNSNSLFPMFGQPKRIARAPKPPPAPKRLGVAATFGQYLRAVGDVVHTGSVRASDSRDNTDFYSVPLTEEALRPGTVYADPYGHVLMIVKRVPQSGGGAGVFLAVDAEPDGTVTRKRFWRGNFLFAHEPALGRPGFKHFRPILRDGKGNLRRLTNAEIKASPQYGDFSTEQAQLDVEAFYDRMDDVMSPEPLDPLRAMQDVIASLDEQVKTRVVAVENGRKWQNSAKGEANMPDGAAIFATTGAWEDFSTPSRDFRLLIAVDVVRHFPDRVARRPERYAMPKDKSLADVKAGLQTALVSELEKRKFSYTRSDGSAWTLSLKDVLDRMVAFEMAYNPNDCVELRWAAPDKSEEGSTCKRHAPAAQRSKMTKYRSWFQERRWPAGA